MTPYDATNTEPRPEKFSGRFSDHQELGGFGIGVLSCLEGLDVRSPVAMKLGMKSNDMGAEEMRALKRICSRREDTEDKISSFSTGIDRDGGETIFESAEDREPLATTTVICIKPRCLIKPLVWSRHSRAAYINSSMRHEMSKGINYSISAIGTIAGRSGLSSWTRRVQRLACCRHLH
ncbi:hypothetical protein BKA81DRAFT_343266 [Phyllosticta paracitricarpa]